MQTTLETVRADFETSRLAHDAAFQECNRTKGDQLSPCCDPAYLSAQDDLCRLAMKRDAAWEIWHIAHNHGLNAAMLYKLSDGAIDPRNASDA